MRLEAKEHSCQVASEDIWHGGLVDNNQIQSNPMLTNKIHVRKKTRVNCQLSTVNARAKRGGANAVSGSATNPVYFLEWPLAEEIVHTWDRPRSNHSVPL